MEGFQRLQRLQKVVYRPQKVLRGPKFKVNSYWFRQSHFVKKKGFINAVEGFQKGTPESFLKTPESFSETPESFRRIHIHFEVILVMAITRAEKVCCGKFANCFLVFCGLVGRACNRERLGEGMINSDFLARAFVNIFLMEILFGKNLRQVELDGKI